MIKKLDERAKNEDEKYDSTVGACLPFGRRWWKFDPFLIFSFKLDSAQLEELEGLVETSFKKEKVEKAMKTFTEIFQPHYRRFLSAYSMDIKEASDSSIDLAILQALLKAQKNLQSQLRLALTWDRVDIAKKYIFSEENRDKVSFSDQNFMARRPWPRSKIFLLDRTSGRVHVHGVETEPSEFR